MIDDLPKNRSAQWAKIILKDTNYLNNTNKLFN